MTKAPLMLPFSTDPNETLRLKALEYLVGSPNPPSNPDPDLDALVEIAALICGTPISLVTLVGEDRQWFRAQKGIDDVHETSREVAFCAHTILQDHVFEVDDTLADPRFATNPLVTQVDGFRFYAGAPLTTRDGQHIGSLCVLDRKPSRLNDDQRKALKKLSQVAVHILEARRAARDHARMATDLAAWNEAVPLGLYMTDSDGRCTRVNGHWAEIYDQPPEESLGDGWMARLHPDDRPSIEAAWNDSVGHGGLFDREFRIRRTDGTVRYVRSLAQALRLTDGSIAGMVGSVEDITALREQALNLEQRRLHLELIVEATGVATIEWNEETGELRPSEQWAAVTGHSLSDFADKRAGNLLDMVHPEDRTEVQSARARAAASPEGTIEVEFRKQHLDGRWIWVLMRAKVVSRLSSGAPEWIFASQIDITKRKEADQRLLQSERLLNRMGDVAGVGGWEFDLERGTLNWTDETCRIHGVPIDYRPDLASGIDFYTQTSRPVINAAVQAAIANGTPFDLELQITRADGRVIWVRAAGSAEIRNGRTTRLWGAFQDIDERVRHQHELNAEHLRLELATESSGIGVWELDLESREIRWDRQMFRLYGTSADLAANPSTVWSGTIVKADRAKVDAAIAATLAGTSRFDTEFRVKWPDGQIRHLRSVAKVKLGPNGTGRVLLGVSWDVTQLRNLTAELSRQHEWMRVTLRSIGDAVITTDDWGVVTWLNPVAELMTGWSLIEAMGQPSSQIFNILHEKTRRPAPNPIEVCLAEERVVGLAEETILLSRGGQTFAVQDSAAPIRDDSGHVIGVVLVFHDVTVERRLSQEMTFRATHDPLTGLKNRSEFELKLEQTLQDAKAEQSNQCLLFIDLDQFKLINDVCGHVAGDAAFQQVARILGENVGPTGFMARLGGDEFAAILPDTIADQAISVAMAICAQMEHYRFTDGDRRFRIGTSVGIVEIDSDWPDSVALLQAADAACLSAKEAGGNNFRLWRARDADIQLQREEIGWAARIAEAIDRDQFCLHIQEIVSVAPSSRRQGEILLRLREADGSLTLPGKFLPAAERFNLIGRIDRWVLIRTIQGLQVDGVLEGIESVSVNLSGRSVADVGFHRFAIDALVGAGAEICKRLIFEITETAAIGHLATAANFIEQLHSIGIRVALDDFGAGTASFGYLRALKVDLLKIDGQFVKNLDGDPLAEVTIRCFVEIAKTLGIEIVAEWVDRPSLVDQLTNMGVDHLQGFHIARPLPIETFLHRRTESVGDRADQ